MQTYSGRKARARLEVPRAICYRLVEGNGISELWYACEPEVHAELPGVPALDKREIVGEIVGNGGPPVGGRQGIERIEKPESHPIGIPKARLCYRQARVP